MTNRELSNPNGPVTVAPLPRTMVSVEDAAGSHGIGRTGVFALIKSGALKAVKVGRRRLIPVAELEAFAARCGQGV